MTDSFSRVTNPLVVDKRIKNLNGLQRSGDREEKSNFSSSIECENTRRKSIRYRVNGIVALTSLEDLVVSNIYNIASGGLSFVTVRQHDITSSEFKMDILVYNNQVEFDFFISRVKGRVKSKQLVPDMHNHSPIWRFGTEFLDLDNDHRNMLEKYCKLVFDKCSYSDQIFDQNIA